MLIFHSGDLCVRVLHQPNSLALHRCGRSHCHLHCHRFRLSAENSAISTESRLQRALTLSIERLIIKRVTLRSGGTPSD
jgi:hypothetical protein